MAHPHSSIPESSRFPEPPPSFDAEAFEELAAPSLVAPQPHALHLDAEGPGGREATHRRVLTRSKLPLEVGQYTYVGGSGEYRGETFAAESQRFQDAASEEADQRTVMPTSTGHQQRPAGSEDSGLATAGAAMGALGIALLVLSQVYVAVPVLAAAGGALYFGRRSRPRG